ncbi:MAG: multicopper oxidase domain-containing protein [Planctomycetes bacterium]|nr:multicopper oxidase domain-containing protein [Planctomycetota bacterium]
MKDDGVVKQSNKPRPGRASRRAFLAASGAASLGAAWAAPAILGQTNGPARAKDFPGIAPGHPRAHRMGGLGTVGEVRSDEYFDPIAYLTNYNKATLAGKVPSRQRWAANTFYRETRRPDGTRLREYQFVAVDREIEIAPGVYFPAWTFNGQVPGPTIRATEGDLVRIRFINAASHPHTMHFHGWHRHEMDGTFPDQYVQPGEEFIYEFEADPVGLHLYHCHLVPLKRHIHKGMYGAFIVDPDPNRYEGALREVAKTRNPDFPENREVRELVMVMNGFDTNFDGENEVYAVNSVAFHYMRHPIPVRVGQLVRVYLVNITEFDPINSFHLHAGFFDVFRTGTKLQTSEHTDTVMMCQGERAILEFRPRWPGRYMFHAHQSEFAELGWMGLFAAQDAQPQLARGLDQASAPDFALVDQHDRMVQLSDYRDQAHLVLVFHLGVVCSFCRDQLALLEQDAATIRGLGAEILAVSSDRPSVNRANVSARRERPFPLLADPDRAVAARYGTYLASTGQELHGTFLIDKHGRIRWKYLGDQPLMDHSALLAALREINHGAKPSLISHGPG